MKTKSYFLLTSLMILAFVLSACSSAAAGPTAQPTSGVPVTAPTNTAAVAVPTVAATTARRRGYSRSRDGHACRNGRNRYSGGSHGNRYPGSSDDGNSHCQRIRRRASGEHSANMQGDPNQTGKIALLLPETKTTRYETADKPYFEERMKQLCPKCEIIYSNANQDATQQLSQAEAALTNGAQVLVLDPVDSASAGAIADKAKAQGVPVIAYDRLILNSSAVNYYISFDNVKVGELQANSLMNALSGVSNPTIVMINGSPTDNNAKLFKQGAHNVFDPLVQQNKLTIAKEYDTPDWSPDQAQNEMQQALTALSNKVDGVYAANDGTASGAIAAMKSAECKPDPARHRAGC